jgi:hypothetical protein
MAKKHNKRGRRPRIPTTEWKMPISFSSDGELVTLRQARDRVAFLDFSQLSRKQQIELVARRIELRKEIKLCVIDNGVIDKARALAEVRSHSRIGQALIEIEQLLIAELLRRLKTLGK